FGPEGYLHRTTQSSAQLISALARLQEISGDTYAGNIQCRIAGIREGDSLSWTLRVHQLRGEGKTGGRERDLWVRYISLQQDRDGIRSVVGHCEIEFAIPIEVSGDNRVWSAAGCRIQVVLERSVSVAYKDGDRIGSGVGGGQINFAISVEIAESHRVWSGSGGDCRLQGKRSISISEEDGN